MNVEFTVRFRGIPEKFVERLEKMLRNDIAFYPQRMSMESAMVEKADEPNKVKSNAEPRFRKPGQPTRQHASDVQA